MAAWRGAANLKYLSIYGTVDWEQPVGSFEFLRQLPALEVLALWQVKCRAPYPAMLPAASLRRLRKLRLHGSYLSTEEYALLEEALKGVEGATWGPYRTVAMAQLELPANDPRARLPADVLRSDHPEVRIGRDGECLVDDPASRWFEFTGRAAGRVKCSSPAAEAKCREASEHYEALKDRARALIGKGVSGGV